MSNLKMVRVDYRLVHGQIVAKWIKFRPVKRLIVVDDELLQDEFMKEIYTMAAPGYEVVIIGLDDVVSTVEASSVDTLLIFKNVETAFNAVKNGLTISELNVGAVPSNADRKSVIQGVALSKDEGTMLNELDGQGINVFLQPIPENDPVQFSSIKSKI